MKIGIDTFGCRHGRSGLGSYLFSLVSHLPDLEDVQYELFGAPIDRYTYSSEKPVPFTSVRLMDTKYALRLWHCIGLNSFASKQKYDAVFYISASHMLPTVFKVPGIALVNDCLSAAFISQKKQDSLQSYFECIEKFFKNHNAEPVYLQ